MPKQARIYHFTALLGFFGLFSLLMFWNTILYPSTKLPIALVLLLAITPLFFPLRGFLNANPRSCAWMAYLSIAYLMHGVVEAYVNPVERMIAGLEVAFSLMLFVGSLLVIRQK
jgi:uncharacterized membrane protein